jgi:heptosyltransferase-2
MISMKIVIRAPNWIGDSILALPAIEAVKKASPGTEVWVAATNWVKDLFLLDGTADGVVPLEAAKDFRSLKENARSLQTRDFDSGILLTNSFGSALLFYLAKIPQRWGYATDGRGALLTARIRPAATDTPRHHLYYYLDLISQLGFGAAKPELKITAAQENIESARRLLLSQGLDPGRPLLILSPGAAYGPAKRWPAERFAQLAARFQQEKSAEILIIGSAAESNIARSIGSAMERKPCILTGQTTLTQLLGLISQAALFISNDTGPMHLANALRVPVVGIFGPTDPAVTGPFEQPSRIVKHDVPCWPCAYRKCPYDHRCLMTIAVEEVFLAGESLWR